MEKNIDEFSQIELESMAYKLVVRIQESQQTLSIVRQQIQKLNSEKAAVKTPKEKPKQKK